jgi:hypothetical protein
MYEATAAPLPSRAEGALQVQMNVNDALASVAEQQRALRFRMRDADLSRTSLRAAECVRRTRARLSDLEHECARLREPLEAIEWEVAL